MRKTAWVALILLGTVVYVSSCNKIEIPPKPDIAPAPTGYVDLGLPSETMWASCNSGADSITELGITYTGGDALKLDYPGWRLPTVAEIKELIDNCKWEWSEYDKGFLVTSKRKGYEDRTIFLPANANSFEAMYWSSTTYKQDKKDFLASLQCKYDDVRDRTKTPTVYTNNLSFTTSYPVRLVRKTRNLISKGMPYVNLGLTSELKWGWYNIGATSDLVGNGKPEGYGDYFAWGDTSTYYMNWKGDYGDTIAYNQWKEEKYREKGYGWSNYKFIKDSYIGGDTILPEREDFTKYAGDTLTLKPEDDVVSFRMGEGWRIPRKEEFEELYNECYWEWTKNYNGTTGVAGYIVYKSQDKATDYQMTKEGTHTYSMEKDLYIFLPAAGYLQGKDFGNANVDGYYWSCELKPEAELPYEEDSIDYYK
ncbi:MAG: hypothetical protein KBT44_05675, partial [Bacteroidales bacterium]|nr:hypothetical protein [Candidatus Equibacterium intestinale]